MFAQLLIVYVCRGASAVLFLLWNALGLVCIYKERKAFACLFVCLLTIVCCFIIFVLDLVEKSKRL